jgi:hypothetical protein
LACGKQNSQNEYVTLSWIMFSETDIALTRPIMGDPKWQQV